MIELSQIKVFAEVVAAFGLPLWAAVVLWLFYQIWRTLRGAIEALKQRDDHLQKMLDVHIAATDKRVSLMEQLLRRHDANIIALFERVDSGRFRRMHPDEENPL